MDYTRVDPKKLAAAVGKVLDHLAKSREAFAEVAVLLHPDERPRLPRPKEGFEKVARNVAHDAAFEPVAAVAEYDPAAVIEDLDNVEMIDKVSAPLAQLAQMVADSKLLWNAEADGMTRALYDSAKGRVKHDAAIAKAVEPLAVHYASPRLKKPDPNAKK